MKYSKDGIALTEHFEGCELRAYPDPGTGNIPWTIGYGHTKGVRQGMVCSQAQAEQWLLEDVASAEDSINRVVKVPLTQASFDALVDFTFNVGIGRLITSTLLKKLNSGDYAGAADEFKKWDIAGGKVMSGLLARRLAEAGMFAS